MNFECDNCGYVEAIANPIRACKPCHKCNEGTMRMVVIAPLNNPKPKIVTISELPETSLMGTLMRGEISSLKPLRTLKRYKVAQCRSCGCVQVTEGLEQFRCRNCDKEMPFRKNGEWYVKLKDFDSTEGAHEECAKWKLTTEQKKIYR